MKTAHLKNWDRISSSNKLTTKITKTVWVTLGSTYSLILHHQAFASQTGNLPFVSTMNMLKESISGPFLLAVAIIMIVATCLMLAFGEWGEGFKKMINVVLWLSVAFAATSFITAMFGSGAVF